MVKVKPVEKNKNSPYYGVDFNDWPSVTDSLIKEFPVDSQTIVSIVQKSWDEIFSIGTPDKKILIGTNAFPQPTTLGYFLHELIAKHFEHLNVSLWQEDPTGYSKDIVNLKNDGFSFEIKTSSSKNRIYGNRSYAAVVANPKKDKSGYYLAVNFGKFTDTKSPQRPALNLIRFGWIDHSDWVGQKSSTGQAAHIPANIERAKLKVL